MPVFIAVPGRARLHVDGLRGQPAFASRLEARIAADAAVSSVNASAITGNVLVRFDPARREVRRLVRAVARWAADVRDGVAIVPRRDESAWHAIAAGTVTARLRTDLVNGLSEEDVARRMNEFGGNRLPVPEPKSTLSIIANHVTSVPVLLLGGAAALSLATGAAVDAVVILAVVGANAVIGYLTESRVERIITSLQNAVVPQAFVRRDGAERIVPATVLVPGDVMILKAGHDVPADGRVVEVSALTVDESALTGESLPVRKVVHTLRADTVLPDRVNMVFAGTVIAEGTGIAVVVETGRSTEFGRVRALVAETATPATPLERQLDGMGRQLVAVSLGFCGAALGLGLLRGVPLLEMLRTVISLAVAAVPEGLPAVATTTLALGMQRMMRQRTLVRRLAAVEGLGATTVICADKTGTLTENRMTVDAWRLGGREYRASSAREPDQLLARALAIGVLCNEAELENGSTIKGSSTEGALLTAAREAGLDHERLRRRYPRVAIRGRVNGENWMGTVHEDGPSRRLIAVKGAPEEVLALATEWLDGDKRRPLSAADRARILADNAAVASRGMRVLGLAFKEAVPGSESYDGLTWVGLVALRDPVRTGVREAIVACRRAGIRPIILTGDQAHTAAAIARELGVVWNGKPRVVEASDLVCADATEIGALASKADIFARVSPAHKYQIVRALQASGHVVVMTGDGINDAAALRAADIGIAMGARGTDVARDVADVVLLDDDVASILAAVEHGRTIHTNIRKTLRFLLSTNASEILVTLGALSLGVARPMSAIQFLWINLMTDVFPALALALEPAEPDMMAQPPRDPSEPILSRPVLAGIGGEAAVLSAATLGVHGLALARYGAGPHATTLAFSTLTTAQLMHAFNCRSQTRSGLRTLGDNPVLAGVVGGSLVLQAATVLFPPLRGLLGLTALSLADWGLVASGVAIPLVVNEMRRAFSRPRTPSAIVHVRHEETGDGDQVA